MHAVVHVVAAVLVRAIGEGSEVVERSFCGLVSVGQPCSRPAERQTAGRPAQRSPTDEMRACYEEAVTIEETERLID